VAGVRIALHVTPKAGRDEVVGWRGSELQVHVRAAPESGKASGAACRVIASALGVPPTSVRVLRGHVSRHKQVEVDGVDGGAVRAVFGEWPEALW
jgi:hypothetical protein